MQRIHFILYVQDQAESTRFYSEVLNIQPLLQVPGITEYRLPGDTILGLMPISGITKLLGPDLPDPSGAQGIPRTELYVVVEDAVEYLDRALAAGARKISPVIARDWGHAAGYVLDPDGHLIAFAHEIEAA